MIKRNPRMRGKPTRRRGAPPGTRRPTQSLGDSLHYRSGQACGIWPAQMTEWLVDILHAFGYWGIFLLLFVARLIPPLPAETIVPLAGTAATGVPDLLLIAVAGGLGSVAGELFWYLPGRMVGRERLERFLSRHGYWLTVRPKQVERSARWFGRRGGLAVLFCQPIPGLRNLICIPAGACRQPLHRFLLYAGLGSFTTVFALAGAGYLVRLGWPSLADYIGAATVILFAGLVSLYLYRLARQMILIRRSRPAGGV